MTAVTKPGKAEAVHRWIPWKKHGFVFRAVTIAKEKNLTTSEVARQLSEYKTQGTLVNRGSEWVVV